MTKDEFQTILEDLSAARRRANQAELDLRMHRAELYLKIKRCPQNFGLEKATENAIEAVLNVDEKSVEREHELLEAKDAQNRAYAQYDLAQFDTRDWGLGVSC